MTFFIYSFHRLSEAYHQLSLDDETSKVLTWSTQRGIYRVNRMPFGAKPNNSIFQAIMEKVLLGSECTIVFIDDIVVTGSNVGEHMKNLRVVLNKLGNAGFTINKTKRNLMQDRIFYLGYIIDSDGLHKYPAKIEAITEMPEPKDETQVKAFCGLVNYYGRFLQNLSCVLKPLYNCVSDGTFQWTKKCTMAMQTVKYMIVFEVVLAHS